MSSGKQSRIQYCPPASPLQSPKEVKNLSNKIVKTLKAAAEKHTDGNSLHTYALEKLILWNNHPIKSNMQTQCSTNKIPIAILHRNILKS